jgi:4-hydroxy-2-oxoheptanedioate aldolase
MATLLERLQYLPAAAISDIQRNVQPTYLIDPAIHNLVPGARAAGAAVKYSPLGMRGAGSGTRAANFGLTQTAAEYFRKANEETFVSALVEESEGIRNLDAIMAVEGVDAVGIGAGDLSMSMGLPGQAGHPDVKKVVVEAEARVVAAGKIMDSVVRDAADARDYAARGSRMIAIQASALFGAAGRAFLADVKK